MNQRKTVTFVPRKIAESMIPEDGTQLISVIHSDQEIPEHHNKWNSITTLVFDDIESKSGDLVRFSEEQAKKVVSIAEDNAPHIVVHCEAGMSRSAAIAKWIADNYSYDLVLHPDGIGTYKFYNRYVYDILDYMSGKSLKAYYKILEMDDFWD